MLWLIGVLFWGLIWGLITKTINENKGYDGGFWWGFFLGFIGLIVVLCKPDNRTFINNNSNSVPNDSWTYGSSPAPVASTNAAYLSYTSAAEKEQNERRILSEGGWKCNKCGRVNPAYTGTCICGVLKRDQEEQDRMAAQKAQAEAEAKENEEKELMNIQKLKAYKDLLDSGIISNEVFEQKKAELLNITGYAPSGRGEAFERTAMHSEVGLLPENNANPSNVKEVERLRNKNISGSTDTQNSPKAPLIQRAGDLD